VLLRATCTGWGCINDVCVNLPSAPAEGLLPCGVWMVLASLLWWMHVECLGACYTCWVGRRLGLTGASKVVCVSTSSRLYLHNACTRQALTGVQAITHHATLLRL
jgi:hypothetical protein